MTEITAEWIDKPETQAVCAMLEAAGKQALFVGGCVRNTLLEEPVSDIDISTDALPEEVMQLAKAKGFRALPTGIDHGTVTVITGHIPHEITTFRKDVETDGRRAVVAYSKHVEDDAHRRDFTMNAIYANSRGELVDPLNGMVDLVRRSVRFIDDPDQRIREDFLRILRFFRFHAWYGDHAHGMDPDALAAIANNLDGLESLSNERVGSELKKLLKAPDPAPVVAAMRATGVLQNILPGSDDRALAPLVHLEQENHVEPDAIRRLAALGEGWAERLRLSKSETRKLERLRQELGSMVSAEELGYRLGEEVALDVLLLRAAVLSTPLTYTDRDDLRFASEQVFPVKSADLMPDFQGPKLGETLKQLERQWIDSGFQTTREQLLQGLAQ